MPQTQIIVNIELVINKMSNIYITSDLHLFHDKDFVYNPRGFDSVEVMIATIVKNLNETINNEDIRLYLTHEDTKALRVGLYKYDMKIKYANGDVDDIISLSDLEITKSATDFD